MRTALLIAASFALVFSTGVAARSQDLDPALVNDVESSPEKNAQSKPKSDRPERDSADSAEAEPKPASEKSESRITGAYDPVTRTGHQSKPVLPDTLAEALTQALQTNPDVLLAEAKLRQAQAEYHQAKLKVVQDVTVALHQWIELQPKVTYQQRMHKKGYASQEELQASKVEAAGAEARLAYLLGLGPELKPSDSGDGKVTVELRPINPARLHVIVPRAAASQQPGKQETPAQHVPAKAAKGVAPRVDAGVSAARRPEIPEKYRQALQKPVEVHFQNQSMRMILDYLNSKAGDELPILHLEGNTKMLDAVPVSAELPQAVPLQTALELVADMTGCVFVFRDYGLLMLPEASFASQYPRSATVPELPAD